MDIMIKTVRVAGFRGLKNLEVDLEVTTILTGMNNTGKTSFLKALQLVLGNRQFISQDDFYIQGNKVSEQITIDILIVPIDKAGKRTEDFLDDWETLFTVERIRTDGNNSFVPLRTIITFDTIRNSYRTQQFILKEWPNFKMDSIDWFDTDNGNKTNFYYDEIPFYYMDAQRDILEDTKLKNSYLGKMLSKIEYSDENIKTIEEQIMSLNEKAVNSSDILSNIKTTLKELDSAMDTGSEGIEITPFTKKIRDFNKGLTIYYSDNQDSFSMEYHGMGTRSWSSLLTLKAFVSLLSQNAKKKKSVFFPILTIEEPEAHLHPNAQKRLYSQMESIKGQKIISTHSPYIPAVSKLSQIRSFYKYKTVVTCGRIPIDKLDDEDIRKINRQVINTRGEIFFSKVIIFFEGETEEQALPVFAKKHFGKTPFEMGLDFVGVGGFGNYLPFLRFAESLNIPWFIISDAENQQGKDVKSSVQSQFAKINSLRNESECIIFLSNGNDFELQLIRDGYTDEIKKAIIAQGTYQNNQHKQAKEQEINDYNDTELHEKLKDNKTKYASIIAEQIVQSTKPIPPKIIELFKKVEKILKIQEVKE